MAWKVWLQSIVAGRVLELSLTPAADSGAIDLSDVTDAEVHIRLQQGGEAIITDTSLSDQTATTLTVLATIGATPEITRSGEHLVTCKLTMNTGVAEWTKPRTLTVKNKYEVDDG